MVNGWSKFRCLYRTRKRKNVEFFSFSPFSIPFFITAEDFRDLNSIAKVRRICRYFLLYIFMFTKMIL